MNSRIAAATAVGALILLGTTGCTFITPQATTMNYAASDGAFSTSESGPVAVRNAMIFVNDNEPGGNFVGALVNDTDTTQTLTVQPEGLTAVTVRVSPNEPISFGATEDPIHLDGFDAPAGSTVRVFFQSGDGTGQVVEVPVLDGALAYYSDLVPTPSPSASPQG